MQEIRFPAFAEADGPARFGLNTRTQLKCFGMFSAVVFDGDVEKAYVKDDDATHKTYAVWFREGGTIELVIENDSGLRLWDSYGVDVAISEGLIIVVPHKPGHDRGKWDAAHSVFSG